MKSIKIKSTHKSLLDAVTEAGIDLEYNRESALKKIDNIQNSYGRGGRLLGVFVTEEKNEYNENDVYYLYECDILLLNKFEPFISSLNSTRFREVTLQGDPKSDISGLVSEILIQDRYYGRDADARKYIGKNNLTVTTEF